MSELWDRLRIWWWARHLQRRLSTPELWTVIAFNATNDTGSPPPFDRAHNILLASRELKRRLS